MLDEKLKYKKEAAFVNREKELKYLRDYMDIRPESILFLHGPKSSGKTILLYKFLEQIQDEHKLDVILLNLREVFIDDYEDFLKTFFKKAESLELTGKGIKPVLIIDGLQPLENIYIDNGRDRWLIIELFNFFVAMTRESHLAHIIIASSDGYFLNTVYNDSRLKKTSEFYKIDYLPKQDVMEWLLNLKKYSKIKDYTLIPGDAEKIWDTVGGSMWEIQHLLNQLFDTPIDEALSLYIRKIKGFIDYYIGTDDKKEKILRVFLKKETATLRDFIRARVGKAQLEVVLKDMVKNNILYFDPTDALYYPQGKSYHHGIRLYFESIKPKKHPRG